MKKITHILWLIAIVPFFVSCDEFEMTSSSTNETVLIQVTDEAGTPIAAEARIVDGKNVHNDIPILAGLNHISVGAYPDRFILRIEKEGFEPYEFQGDRQTMKNVHHVALKALVVLTLETSVDDDVYVLDLEGVGSITIVWPDGRTEQSTMPLTFSSEFNAGGRKSVFLKRISPGSRCSAHLVTIQPSATSLDCATCTTSKYSFPAILTSLKS